MMRRCGWLLFCFAVVGAAGGEAQAPALSDYQVKCDRCTRKDVIMGRHDFCALSVVQSGGPQSFCSIHREPEGWVLTAVNPAHDTGPSQVCHAVCMDTSGSGRPPQAVLTSGTYSVSTQIFGSTYVGTFRLNVSGGTITGDSEWSCCPGPRTDPLRGRISGNQVIIERDCTGQGFGGACHQVYTATIGGSTISGSFTHNGADSGTWTMQKR